MPWVWMVAPSSILLSESDPDVESGGDLFGVSKCRYLLTDRKKLVYISFEFTGVKFRGVGQNLRELRYKRKALSAINDNVEYITNSQDALDF